MMVRVGGRAGAVVCTVVGVLACVRTKAETRTIRQDRKKNVIISDNSRKLFVID
jgi:hypothetical protein